MGERLRTEPEEVVLRPKRENTLSRSRFREAVFRALAFALRALRGTRAGRVGPLKALWNRLFEFSRPKGVVLRQIQGSRMYVDADDRGLGQALLLGVFEPFQTVLFTDSLRESATVVDVGANIGYYSLLAARRVGDRGRVFAMEPNPETYSMLLQNIKINDYRNVIPLQICVSNCRGKAQFHLDRAIPGESALSLCGGQEDPDAIAVETSTLDEILGDDGVDVLKIDVEGAEGLVLLGGQSLLRRTQPTIFMEFVPRRLAKMGTRPGDVLAFLKGCGYSFLVINEKIGRLDAVSEAELVGGAGSSAENIACVPAAKGWRPDNWQSKLS